ncbi:hypothetical protein KC353_g2012 [Hortaea werneckii]|uniref:Transcription factor domain-containing protein n=1 Tax=Hortaea werneckii TaxID=91943 RepID=A0A3M7CXJ3_HORWE|nr:hypothetical protein KC353_g2012 [Hortaea werneckii]RMY56731.1 hypothetical protein D0865_03490 [Hortaea werneckii]
MSLQLSAYLSTIKPSVNFRQNLALNYGAFLEDIPQRLGKNKALDAAVTALVSAHSNVCCKRKATPQTLVKYSLALEALKSNLDCVHEASSSETLCAIMVLLICQNFLGVPPGQWTGHCEGAAHILRARGFRKPLDHFESRLLMSARGSVLVEGIFNPAIHFADDEWRRIVELDVSYESEAVEGKVLRHLASIPSLTRQAKKLPMERQIVIVEAQSHLAAIGNLMKKTRDQLRSVEAEGECPLGLIASMIHAAAMRAYGFCLAGALIMHHMIRCLDVTNATSALESAVLVDEPLQLAKKANTYTPFASAHMHFVLAAAYINAATDDQRQAIQIAISAYQIDCSGDSWTSLHSPGLQWLDDLRYGFDMLVA